jgi:hypothetical protein
MAAGTCNVSGSFRLSNSRREGHFLRLEPMNLILLDGDADPKIAREIFARPAWPISSLNRGRRHA